MAVQTLIQANDCLFQLDFNGVYVDVLCFKSFTVTITTDEKEITTVGDGQFKSFDYKVLSWNVSLNGGMKIPDAVNPTLFDMIDWQLGFIEVPFRCIYNGSGGLRFFKGTAIVKSSNIVTNASQIADGTIDMLGTGAFEVGSVIQVLVDLNLIMTGDPSAIALAKFKLIDDTGQVVFQTDTLPQASSGQLVNPFNFTTQIQQGTYYLYWQVQCNNVGNTFNTDAPPTLTQNFNNGTNNYSSFGIQKYDFTTTRTVTFTLGTGNPPPTCVPPVIPGSPTLPDGTQYTPYSASFAINGSSPFNITNVVKPSWMNINVVTISGVDYIQLTGTPDVSGTGITVSFDINNACGTVSFSDTINISSAASPIPINWSFTETSGESTGFRLWVNGIIVVNTDVPGSGTVNVNAFDSIEVFVVGNTLTIKHLKVEETTAPSTLYDTTSGGGYLSFSWPAVSFKAYQVTAEGL